MGKEREREEGRREAQKKEDKKKLKLHQNTFQKLPEMAGGAKGARPVPEQSVASTQGKVSSMVIFYLPSNGTWEPGIQSLEPCWAGPCAAFYQQGGQTNQRPVPVHSRKVRPDSSAKSPR